MRIYSIYIIDIYIYIYRYMYAMYIMLGIQLLILCSRGTMYAFRLQAQAIVVLKTTSGKDITVLEYAPIMRAFTNHIS